MDRLFAFWSDALLLFITKHPVLIYFMEKKWVPSFGRKCTIACCFRNKVKGLWHSFTAKYSQRRDVGHSLIPEWRPHISITSRPSGGSRNSRWVGRQPRRWLRFKNFVANEAICHWRMLKNAQTIGLNFCSQHYSQNICTADWFSGKCDACHHGYFWLLFCTENFIVNEKPKRQRWCKSGRNQIRKL